jgi:threonine/homoserine/homoserine lactone efflux protein
VWLQLLLLGLTFAGLGFASDSLYAVVAGTVADRLRGTPHIARVERWFGGTVLIGLGVAAAIIAPHRSS